MTLMQNKDTQPQILRTKDGVVTIEVVKDLITDSVFPQCDFSFVDLPVERADAKILFTKLFDSQRHNHCCLCTARQPRKFRLKALSSALEAEEVGFKFHDVISMIYEEPYKAIPSNLTQTGEVAILFTRANDLNKSATSWFHSDFGDCTNVWDFTLQEGEKALSKTVSRHFCMEAGILMANCASPLVCRRFLILQPPEQSHVEFAHKFNMRLHAITVDELSAKRAIRYYNSNFYVESKDGKRN